MCQHYLKSKTSPVVIVIAGIISIVISTVSGALLFPQKKTVSAVLHPISRVEEMVKTMNPEHGPAAVKIVEISSFTCKHCRDVQKPLQRLQDTFDSVSHVFLPYGMLSGPSGVYARAFIAAGNQGKGMAMKNALFHQQSVHNRQEIDLEGLALSTVFRIADSLGLHLDSFEHDLYNQTTKTLLGTIHREVKKASITSTPVVIINGFAVKGALCYRGYEKAVRTLLSREATNG